MCGLFSLLSLSLSHDSIAFNLIRSFRIPLYSIQSTQNTNNHQYRQIFRVSNSHSHTLFARKEKHWKRDDSHDDAHLHGYLVFVLQCATRNERKKTASRAHIEHRNRPTWTVVPVWFPILSHIQCSYENVVHITLAQMKVIENEKQRWPYVSVCKVQTEINKYHLKWMTAKPMHTCFFTQVMSICVRKKKRFFSCVSLQFRFMVLFRVSFAFCASISTEQTKTMHHPIDLLGILY